MASSTSTSIARFLAEVTVLGSWHQADQVVQGTKRSLIEIFHKCVRILKFFSQSFRGFTLPPLSHY
jgi:hypothetical protein